MPHRSARAKRTHAKCTQTFRSVPVCSGFRPLQNSSTSRSPMPHRSARAKRTHAKCTQAFRSVPVCSGVFRFPPAPKFLNISQPHGAQVCTRKTHSRKMHTSVPVCSGFCPPQNSSTFRSPVPWKERLEPNIWWLLGITPFSFMTL